MRFQNALSRGGGNAWPLREPAEFVPKVGVILIFVARVACDIQSAASVGMQLSVRVAWMISGRAMAQHIDFYSSLVRRGARGEFS